MRAAISAPRDNRKAAKTYQCNRLHGEKIGWQGPAAACGPAPGSPGSALAALNSPGAGPAVLRHRSSLCSPSMTLVLSGERCGRGGAGRWRRIPPARHGPPVLSGMSGTRRLSGGLAATGRPIRREWPRSVMRPARHAGGVATPGPRWRPCCSALPASPACARCGWPSVLTMWPLAGSHRSTGPPRPVSSGTTRTGPGIIRELDAKRRQT
jgi:hypothetical protein